MKNLFFILLVLYTPLICVSQSNVNNIKLIYPDGEPCKIEDFKGKFILVDIWGQGCKPCVRAIPELNELQKKYEDKLVILAINDRIYLEKLPQFLKEHKVNYRVVMPTTDADLMPIYYVFSEGKFSGFPLYTLIDKTGKILKRNTHYTDVESYFKQ